MENPDTFKFYTASYARVSKTAGIHQYFNTLQARTSLKNEDTNVFYEHTTCDFGVLLREGLISLWLYKENKLRD
jgi:hypothetical protein